MFLIKFEYNGVIEADRKLTTKRQFGYAAD